MPRMISRITVLLCTVSVGALCACGRDQPDRAGRQDRPMAGMMNGMPHWMMSDGMMMDADMMRDMHVIHELLLRHDDIARKVDLIPGGVRTVTTSSDPEVTRLIRAHVGQMRERIATGSPIRMMDPVFREIFRHHDRIRMETEEIPGGVQVMETSNHRQVVLLIRQHANRAVSEFVSGGMQRAMRPTPLPEGYSRDSGERTGG